MNTRWPSSAVKALLVRLITLVSLAAGCADPTQPAEPPVVEQPASGPAQTPPSPPPTGPAVPKPEYVYLATTAGVITARLTLGSHPAWSPDGRRIAFQRAREGSVRDEVHVINADGSGETRLPVGAEPTWSPDGTKIVFTSDAGISIMNADGSGVRTLIRHDFRDDTYEPWDMGIGRPSWSPDGTQIAFEHLGDGDIEPAQIFVMGADGSNPRRLTTPPNRYRYAESDPAWSPDGTKVAHWSYGYGIAVVDSRGGAPNALYHAFPDVAYGANPAWSPDGHMISFNRRQGTARAVWIVSTSGLNARQLIDGAYDAVWSPDGRQLAVVSTRVW